MTKEGRGRSRSGDRGFSTNREDDSSTENACEMVEESMGRPMEQDPRSRPPSGLYRRGGAWELADWGETVSQGSPGCVAQAWWKGRRTEGPYVDVVC